MTTTPRFHAVTWLVWALAAVVSLQVAPSALYVALVLLVTLLVVEVHGRSTPLARTFPFFVALGAAFGALRVVLTVLTTHGSGQVLVTLPAVTLPRLLGGFTVGGTVELEVLLRAATESFVIVAMIAVFAAWNAVVSHHEVLQSTPRAFHEPGLIVTVALAFVPSTVAALRATQESDSARTGGRVVRRGRLVRLVVPVLESGLERAVALAASMDSRGFGRGGAGRAEHVAAWLGLGALLALGGAFVALVGRPLPVAAALGAAGVLATVLAVTVASRASRRVRYRPRRLTPADRAVMAAVLAAPCGLALLSLAGNDTLTWEAGRLEVPGFDLRAALAVLALAVPAAFGPRVAPARESREQAAGPALAAPGAAP